MILYLLDWDANCQWDQSSARLDVPVVATPTSLDLEDCLDSEVQTRKTSALLLISAVPQTAGPRPTQNVIHNIDVICAQNVIQILQAFLKLYIKLSGIFHCCNYNKL
jgi:hypothetical protein